MFDLIVIVVIAALAFPVIAIVALIKTIGLRDQARRLELRVATLEGQIRLAGDEAQYGQRAPPPSPADAPVVSPPPPPSVSQAPPPIPAEASPAAISSVPLAPAPPASPSPQ